MREVNQEDIIRLGDEFKSRLAKLYPGIRGDQRRDLVKLFCGVLMQGDMLIETWRSSSRRASLNPANAAVDYIKATGRVPLPIAMFDEDNEPAGLMLRSCLVDLGWIVFEGEDIYLTDKAPGPLKRGERRVVGNNLCEFLEEELEGQKWAILRPIA